MRRHAPDDRAGSSDHRTARAASIPADRGRRPTSGATLGRIDGDGIAIVARRRAPRPAADFDADAHDRRARRGRRARPGRPRGAPAASPATSTRACSSRELAAAVAGGVTSLVCPPDTDPVLDEPGLVEMLKFRARNLNLARVYPLGALTRGLHGEELTEMAELTEAGCVGFAQADVADPRHAGAAPRAAVRGDLRLHRLAAPERRLARQRRRRQGAARDAPGPVRRAGARRDDRAGDDLRAGARHRRARPPVPPEQRRRRRAGAPRQGRGAAGDLRRRASTSCT